MTSRAVAATTRRYDLIRSAGTEYIPLLTRKEAIEPDTLFAFNDINSILSRTFFFAFFPSSHPGGIGDKRFGSPAPVTMAPKDTFFRSSDMSLTQLYIANEIGRDVVSALGELGQVQFRDVSWSLGARS